MNGDGSQLSTADQRQCGVVIDSPPDRSREIQTQVAAWFTLGGKFEMNYTRKRIFVAACFLAFATNAMAGSAYEGSWNLVFSTQRGACDPTYDFVVNISNGNITHPNLLKFRGHVAKSGAVRASVTVGEKYASGSGRLSGALGQGTWSGRAENARCTGYWTAQRN
jgi:hypothetical protein